MFYMLRRIKIPFLFVVWFVRDCDGAGLVWMQHSPLYRRIFWRFFAERKVR